MSRIDRPRAGDAGEPAPSDDGTDDVLVFSRASVRDVDRLAVEQYGIPSIVLMENAALHLAEVALDLADEDEPPRILVVCGPGNNGGDGLAAARHLSNAGAHVQVLLSGPADRYTGDAAINLGIVQRMGLPLGVIGKPPASLAEAAAALGGCDILIDALLGTGLDQPVREPLAGLIRSMNDMRDRGATVVSADLPSGLDADSGEPLGVAVKADTTVSFVGLKEGFLKLGAQPYIGEVIVADIGAPADLTRRLGRRLAAHEPHDASPTRRETRPPGPRRPDA
jgi:NAD(P)H-hydrate epimerase